MISLERVAPRLPSDDPLARLARSGSGGSRLRLSLADVWVAAVVLVPAIALVRSKLWMIDLAYHVRAGGLMLASQHVLRTDPFSFASTGSWFDQQWLSQVVFAAVFHVAGWTGLELLRIVLAAAVALSINTAARRRGAQRKRAAILAILATMCTFPGLILRPQLFGLVFFGVVQMILLERDRHPALLFALPPLFAAWANMHGTFPLGLVLVGLAIVERLERRRSIKRLSVVLGLSALATGLTPWGYAVWRYVVELSTNRRVVTWVREWQPTTLRSLPGIVFFATVVGVAVVLGRSRAPLRWSAIFTLGVFFVLGVSSVRGTYWWAIASAPVVAEMMPGRDQATLEWRSALNTILAGIVVAGLLLLSTPWIVRPGDMLSDAPSALSARLEGAIRPGDRVLAAQRWASWLEYVLPSNSLFVDSRVEVYPDGVWRSYESISRAAPGWQRRLDSWGIDYVAAERDDQRLLIAALDSAGGWRRLYAGSDGVLFARG
jgi:hypothetical protein